MGDDVEQFKMIFWRIRRALETTDSSQLWVCKGHHDRNAGCAEKPNGAQDYHF